MIHWIGVKFILHKSLIFLRYEKHVDKWYTLLGFPTGMWEGFSMFFKKVNYRSRRKDPWMDKQQAKIRKKKIGMNDEFSQGKVTWELHQKGVFSPVLFNIFLAWPAKLSKRRWQSLLMVTIPSGKEKWELIMRSCRWFTQ